MHMPRLGSIGSQERRSHIPNWEPLYMEDSPEKEKEQGGKRQSGMTMGADDSKVQLKNPFCGGADDDDDDDDVTDHGCCAWKLCVTFMTANWMSRAM